MTLDVNLFTFRVLTEKDSTYGYSVAHCLETGTVVTADDHETVVEMMLEVLQDEILYALKHRDYSNLFSSPAPADVWQKWKEAAKRNKPIQMNLEVKADDTKEIAEVHLGESKAA